MRKFIIVVFILILVSCTTQYKPKYTVNEIHKILIRNSDFTEYEYRINLQNNILIINKSNPVYVVYMQSDFIPQSQIWYSKSDIYITSDFFNCKYSKNFKLLESNGECGQLALEEAQNTNKSFDEDLESLGLNQKDIEFYVNNFEY